MRTGSQNHSEPGVKHYVGRIGSPLRAAKRIAHIAVRRPELFDSFNIKPCEPDQSGKDLPVPATPESIDALARLICREEPGRAKDVAEALQKPDSHVKLDAKLKLDAKQMLDVRQMLETKQKIDAELERYTELKLEAKQKLGVKQKKDADAKLRAQRKIDAELKLIAELKLVAEKGLLGSFEVAASRQCDSLKVHAELTVAERMCAAGARFYADDRFVGCCKPACLSCYWYIVNHPAGFVPPACHTKTWMKWGVPIVEEEGTGHGRVRTEAIRCVTRELRKAAVTVLLSGGQSAWRPDSTDGITARH